MYTSEAQIATFITNGLIAYNAIVKSVLMIFKISYDKKKR